MARDRYRIAFLIDYLNSEYSDFVLRGIKIACEKFGMDLLIFPIAELHNLQASYNYQYVATTALLTHSNIDGIILPAGTQMRYLSRRDLMDYLSLYKDFPIISIGCELEGIPSITVDCSKAYKELIDYLIDEQKCRKFGIMGVRSKSVEATKRTEAILSALESKGISKDSVYRWTGNFDFNSTYAELEHYYSETGTLDFDTILCLNDEMAFATEAFCKNIGKRIPQDITIVGYDNIERDSFSQPSMTSIDQSILDQGFEAVRVMKAILEKGEVPEIQTIESVAYCRESTNRIDSAKREDSDVIKFDLDGTQFSSKYTATEWFLKKFQLYQVTNFYTDMQMDITTAELKERINDDLRSFGMKSAAIVLFDNPIVQPTPFDVFEMPKKASVYSAFDDTIEFDSSKSKKIYKFNPCEKILPEGILAMTPDGHYVISLFHSEIQYGYFVFRSGEYDIAIYDMLSKILSSIINTIITYKEVRDERTLLRTKYFQLDKEACSDELTGLNNRRGLFNFGQAILDVGKAMEQTGLIIFCDMDGLKKINDTYGHAEGDRAIIAEAEILKRNFRATDVLGRIGGDEFAMVCPGLSVEAFELIKQDIINECKDWTMHNEVGFELSLSMGYSQYPSKKSGYQITKLLSEADSLQYIEKRAKRQNSKKLK